MKLDYLIKNGHVVDSIQNIDGIADIGVVGTRIVSLKGKNNIEANNVIDAKDCYVFPGLIDFHTHLFHEGSDIAIRLHLMLAQGTTAACDAGTAGTANFEAFYSTVIAPSTVKIKGYITTYAGGQLDSIVTENFNPDLINVNKLHKLIEEFPDRIMGLKIRLSKGVVPDGEAGLDYLKRVIELADKLGQGLSVCVHTTNQPISAEKIAAVLRSGDIYCHCYQGVGNTIIGEDRKVLDAILEARKRGVIFDAANGKGNFGIEIAKEAIKQGFLPDIISTDLTIDKFNMPPYAKNFPTVISKYLDLGLDIKTIIKCVTETPAKLIGLSNDIGSLRPGGYADIAIMKKKRVEFVHKDFRDEEFAGHVLLVPQLTMCNGEIQYC